MGKINGSDTSSRFIFENNKFNIPNKRVKPRVYEPPPSRRLSIFITSTMSDQEIWRHGAKHVAPIRGKPILARSDLLVEKIELLGLKVESSPPPPYHAEIVNWPTEKSEIKLLAKELAAEATPVSREG